VTRLRAAALLLPLALLAAACGSSAKQPSAAQLARGKTVFLSAGCGQCHSLAAANAKGVAGGPLDGLKFKEAFVEQRVRFGGGGMPQFHHRLSDADIKAVSGFVSDASSR
jgi:mono/diheme cytochrome c family protein